MADTARDRDASPRERGTVAAIHVAPDRRPTPMEPRDAVDAVADRGLRGDRYFEGTGTYSIREDLPPPADVTLIEAEAVEAIARDHDIDIGVGETRRNIATRDVALNHLVDREFRVGGARLEGIALCEPCQPLADVVDEPELVPALTHRGGLDARIVDSGRIAVGDPIEY